MDSKSYQLQIAVSDGKAVYCIWGESEAVKSIILTEDSALVSYKKNDAIWLYKKIEPMECLAVLFDTNSLGKTMWYIKKNFTELEQNLSDGITTITPTTTT